MYVSTIEYDQAALTTACDAVVGCVFDPLAYTEFAVALWFKDISASGACYGIEKKSLGVYFNQVWTDGVTPDEKAAFHLVFENAALSKFLTCGTYLKNSMTYCNSINIPANSSYWKLCDDGSFFNEGESKAGF
jgi:hypothetical protein